MTESFIKGNLRYWKAGENSNSYQVTLLRCPACGVKFSHGPDRESHLRNDHEPEDFGLGV